MQGRLVNLQAVFPEHVQERCFSSIIQAKKEDFGVFVVKAWASESDSSESRAQGRVLYAGNEIRHWFKMGAAPRDESTP